MKDKNINAEFTEEKIKEKRKFPVGYTVFLVICIAVQIIAVIFAATYDPKPQDVIENYRVTVAPLDDGTLDITYELVWHALDTEEALTWIEVGIANEHVRYYPDYTSSKINNVTKDVDDEGGTYIVLDLDRKYYGGDVLYLSFTINQQQILCKDGDGYFYEFVPGWFNSTPVEKYEFRWKLSPDVTSHNAMREEKGYAVWSGEMPCGTYELMRVNYDGEAFEGQTVVHYRRFDDSGVFDQLKEDKGGIVGLCVLLILGIAVGELMIIDGFVSYHRGRGFMRGYGYHVHVYGRVNPHYSRAAAAHNSSRGGSRGGGCACACACACAGGGRAGCSQKDTFENKKA